MLLQIFAAVGAILALLALTVFLPGWAMTGSALEGFKAWVIWCAGMAAVLIPGALFGALWAWLEYKGLF